MEEEFTPIGGAVELLFSDTSALNSASTIRHIAFENRLETQFIRVSRIDCDYNILGADAGFVVPSSQFGTGTVLGAQPGSEVTDFAGDALLCCQLAEVSELLKQVMY